MSVRQKLSNLIFLMMFFTTAFWVAAALAGDVPATYAIDVHQGLNALIGLVFAALGAVGGWLAAFIKSKFKLTQATGELLDAAIHSALAYALQKAQAAANNIDDPQVKSKVIADAANLVLGNIPSALSALKISEESLRLMIQAKLPVVHAQAEID